MAGRLKKSLSLKQRKLAFQSVTTNPAPQIPQAYPICKATEHAESAIEDLAPVSSCKNDPLPNELYFSTGLCNLGFCTSVIDIELTGQKKEADDISPLPTTLSRLLARLWQRMIDKEQTISKPSNKVSTLSPTKPDRFLAKLREENPLFNNRAQHDAQEMLRFLLSNLHETYASHEGPPTNSHVDTNPKPAPPLKQPPQTNGTLKSIPDKRKLPTRHRSSKYAKLNSGKGKRTRTLNSFFCPSTITNSPPVAVTEESRKPCQLISSTFQGYLAYETHCFECENTTRRSETFLDISVPVSTVGFPGFPPISSPIKTSSLIGASVVGPYSLSWCLSQFALREKLRGDNKYHCDECGRLTEAERSLLFSELPTVMTVHLNRFVAQAWGHSSSVTVSKIGGNVAVPLALNFKPWTTEDCKGRDKMYTLFAIVFHSGSSCTSGHYTACVRALETVKETGDKKDTKQYRNSWLYFDDEIVELLSQKELCAMISPLSDFSSTAYILFYVCQ